MIEVRRTGRKVTGIKLRRGPGYGGAGYRTLHEEVGWERKEEYDRDLVCQQSWRVTTDQIDLLSPRDQIFLQQPPCRLYGFFLNFLDPSQYSLRLLAINESYVTTQRKKRKTPMGNPNPSQLRLGSPRSGANSKSQDQLIRNPEAQIQSRWLLSLSCFFKEKKCLPLA